MKPDLVAALERASADVLETMFFTEPCPAVEDGGLRSDAVSCRLDCTGAVNGAFSLVIERGALELLSEGFYGQEDKPFPTADVDLACELANMLAGATLSDYLPQQSCSLSSPLLSSLADHQGMRRMVETGQETGAVDIQLDGGALSLLCVLAETA